MKNTLAALLNAYPPQVKFNEVEDFDSFDERVSAVDILVTNTIGVSAGYVEFIPDSDPPLKEEVYCWIWLIRPDLSKELLLQDISDDFRLLLNAYINNNMDEFWDHINKNE
jgi:hypothetical protein